MSKVFYDHLIILEEVETEIKNVTETPEEKEELWKLIDEIVHHRILGSILDVLPREHHEEFLTKFHEAPHSEYLLSFLDERTEESIEEIIRKEIKNVEKELLLEIKGKKDNG